MKTSEAAVQVNVLSKNYPVVND